MAAKEEEGSLFVDDYEEDWRGDCADDDDDPVEVVSSTRAETSGAFVGGVAVLLCIICGKNARMKSQVYCAAPCGGHVKAAYRDAKRQGKEAVAALTKLKREGGASFSEAIHTYQSKCAGFGRGFRRPSFHWVRYWMAIQFASRVQTGTKSLWLTRGAFIHSKKIDDELTYEEAQAAWAIELESLPPSQISADRKKILKPMESFVIQLNERSQLEQVEYGHKEEKNPSSADIQEKVDWMGKDHTSFGNNQHWGATLGLGEGLLQGLGGEGTFATSSAVQAEKEKLVEDEERLVREKAERKEKAQAKKAAKPFDDGRKSTLEVEFADTARNIEVKSRQTIDHAQNALTQLESSIYKDTFNSAKSILERRLDGLKAVHGDPKKSLEQNVNAFDTFKARPDVVQAMDKGEGPSASFFTMVCLAKLKCDLQTFEINSEADVKRVRGEIKSKKVEYEALLSRIKDQTGRVNAAVKKKVAADEREAEKELKTHMHAHTYTARALSFQVE